MDKVNSRFRYCSAYACDLNKMVYVLREYWTESANDDRNTHTSLAVLQGLIERVQFDVVEQRIYGYFDRNFRSIKNGYGDPVLIENEGARLGLPVCDMMEEVLNIHANFGVVKAINDVAAHLILFADNDETILEELTIPKNMLPASYREKGVGIAWIERRYASSVKGRFEPGSYIQKIDNLKK